VRVRHVVEKHKVVFGHRSKAGEPLVGVEVLAIREGFAMRLYERRFRNAQVALLAAGCIWLMSLVPTGAEDLTIQSMVEMISAEASKLSEAGHGAHPAVDDIANKALNLSTIMARLDAAIEKEPGEAASHVDALKRLAADEIDLGLAITSLSDADANTAKDLIANMAAVADSIKDDAAAY
jgi:hypothetical protein